MITLVPIIPGLLMSKGFAPAAAQQANRPKALEALALSQRLKDCFASIKDPRVERTRLHQLGDILTIAILSVLAGGNGWEDMEVYGRKYSGVVIDVFGVAQWHSQC